MDAFLVFDVCLKGINKFRVNAARFNEDFESALAALAEPFRSVMQRYALSKPYERLKSSAVGERAE